jgi:hypothetical protein
MSRRCLLHAGDPGSARAHGHQGLGVVAGQIIRAVVDQHDALGLLVADVHGGGGDVLPAQLGAASSVWLPASTCMVGRFTTMGRYWPWA